jgi:hypothetical protein
MNPIEETIKEVIYNHRYIQTIACEGISVGLHSSIGHNEQYVKVVINPAADPSILKEWLESLRDLKEYAIVPVFSNDTRIILVDFSSRPYPVGPPQIPDFSASHMVDCIEKALKL